METAFVDVSGDSPLKRPTPKKGIFLLLLLIYCIILIFRNVGNYVQNVHAASLDHSICLGITTYDPILLCFSNA